MIDHLKVFWIENNPSTSDNNVNIFSTTVNRRRNFITEQAECSAKYEKNTMKFHERM